MSFYKKNNYLAMDFDKIFIQCHRATCRYLFRIFDDRFRSDFNSFEIEPRVIIRKDNYWRSISIRFLSNMIVPLVVIFSEYLRIDFDQVFNTHASWPIIVNTLVFRSDSLFPPSSPGPFSLLRPNNLVWLI